MLTKLEETILLLAPFKVKGVCANTGLTAGQVAPVLEGMERKGLLVHWWERGSVPEWRLTDFGFELAGKIERLRSMEEASDTLADALKYAPYAFLGVVLAVILAGVIIL